MLPDELALGGSEHSGGFVAPAMTCSCQPVKRRQRVCRTRNMGWKEGVGEVVIVPQRLSLLCDNWPEAQRSQP